MADNYYFSVDKDTREVYIPTAKSLFGVAGDKDSNVLHFRVPRKLSDVFDLNDAELKINWRNANNETSYYLVADKTIDGDMCEFSWVLENTLMGYKGTVYFIVCARIVNSEGKVIRDWNSRLGKGTVEDGFHPTTAPVPVEVEDQILQLLKIVNDKQSEVMNACDGYLKQIQDEGQSQINAIDKKGNSLLEKLDTITFIDKNDIDEICGKEYGEWGGDTPVSIDYETIVNKPKINSVTLEGNKKLEDLGIGTVDNSDILELLNQ